MQLAVLDNAEAVDAELRARGATVHREGSVLEVTAPSGDPYELVTAVLADTGSGLRLLKPTMTTLEDSYLSEGQQGLAEGGASA